ncbi:winged helix-turn-helix domain-containing protein [Halorussus marinus]|uniref:winged helix-turn-helix domain-containing protein n=1 Tax=Halorussus marinus TaxID=2505976 RepID=UPI001091AA5D|nr:winged helix-turn-helix domain-containing protein [Halorussus marinus]
MKLAKPTDFEILEILDDRGRNTAQNLALILDKNRGYINTRLPHLSSLGLVRRVGPAENSGLYEVTQKGRIVLDHRETYGQTEEFEELIRAELDGNL